MGGGHGGAIPEGDIRADRAVLSPTEDRTDFVRAAVEQELQRREAKSQKKPGRK